LLQHDTVDKNGFWNLRIVFNFVQTSTKNFLQLTFVIKCRFSATCHVLFLTGVTAFLSNCN